MMTLAPATIAVLAFDLVPGVVSGQKVQVAQRAVACRIGPGFYERQFGGDIVEKASLFSQDKLESAFAQIISSALGQDGCEILRQISCS